MKLQQKLEIREFIYETLLYGVLVALFCLGAIRLLGRPLQALFHQHRAGYAILALLLMMVQGLMLERFIHAACSLFRRKRKGLR